MAQKHIQPQSRIAGADGRPLPEWHRYLSGIEEISKRLNAVDDIAGGATLADAIAKLNEILAAFRATD